MGWVYEHKHFCGRFLVELGYHQHYVKTSNRLHNICNGPLTPVTCTHICNGCCLASINDKRDMPTPRLASAIPVTNVDF
jgi:hypothetical protein